MDPEAICRFCSGNFWLQFHPRLPANCAVRRAQRSLNGRDMQICRNSPFVVARDEWRRSSHFFDVVKSGKHFSFGCLDVSELACGIVMAILQRPLTTIRFGGSLCLRLCQTWTFCGRPFHSAWSQVPPVGLVSICGGEGRGPSADSDRCALHERHTQKRKHLTRFRFPRTGWR